MSSPGSSLAYLLHEANLFTIDFIPLIPYFKVWSSAALAAIWVGQRLPWNHHHQRQPVVASSSVTTSTCESRCRHTSPCGISLNREAGSEMQPISRTAVSRHILTGASSGTRSTAPPSTTLQRCRYSRSPASAIFMIASRSSTFGFAHRAFNRQRPPRTYGSFRQIGQLS